MVFKKGIIFIFILILCTQLVFAMDIYMDVELFMTHDSIIATDVNLYEGLPQSYVLEYDDSYDVRIYSVNNELLEEFTLRRSFHVFDSPVGTLNETYDSVSFQYYRNIGNMEMWYEGELMLDLDLTDYMTCNFDGICDPWESPETCPEDCIIEPIDEDIVDEIITEPIDEDIVDEVITEPIDEDIVEDREFPWIYLIIGILVLILLFIIFLIKKQNK